MDSDQPTSAGGNAMWGGRFSAGPDSLMEAINASIDVDRRLHAQDIAASKVHCRMLVRQNILSTQDGDAILAGLDEIGRELEEGRFTFDRALEDIHMNVEGRLKERIGEVAGRLHTARSRNDQVATDFRLWIRDAIDDIDTGLRDLQKTMVNRAEAHAATIMPGFTHLQTAQAVTFGHHMLAYVEMLGRDRSRFADARRRQNECPLGAGALAGTTFSIDRDFTAAALGFDRPMANSLDAVSDRDFVLEFLAAAAFCAMHLSRLAEELVIWASSPFSFIRLSEGFTTGSSMMPQKRNPDAAELVRAKMGRIVGALITLLTMMKGLPLAYSKDMQEDKEATFDAADTLRLSLAAMTGMIETMELQPEAMRRATTAGFPTATDLADWLVRALGMPFREAHHVTGQLVRLAESEGCDLGDLSLARMQTVEPRLTEDILEVVRVDSSVTQRRSYGGTAPENVRAQVKAARTRFGLSETEG